MTGNGELALAGGPRDKWDWANLWPTKYVKTEALGQELVWFGNKSGPLTMGAVVEVVPAGAEAPDLPLLLTYGYCLLLLVLQDSGAVAVAASTTVTSGD